jgi:RHS repeat-associated protein
MTILKNIVFTLLLIATTLFAYCQQPAAWSHPIFKAIDKKAANIVTFSHKDSNNYYVPLAVLNKTTAKLYYINTFGFVFDSLPIAPMLLKELAAKKQDAFALYPKLVTTIGLVEIQQMKEKVKDKKLDKAKIISKQTFIDYTSLLNAVSTFEQLTLLDNLEKEVWQNHYLINLVLADKKDTAFLTKQSNFASFKPCKIFLHQQKEHSEVDYVEFTSCNRFSRLNKAVLMPATANIYLYNRLDKLVDSFKVKKEKLKDITADKQDVFALYRMWLEWQMENTDKQIEKLLPVKSAKFDEVSLTESQLLYLDTLLRYANFTQQKISYTTRPDKDLLLANMLEQSKTAPRKKWTATTQQWQDVPMPQMPPPTPATIAMPGGYTGTLSTFTRGEKEYFLTDHRGNVMATVTDRKIQVDNNNDGIVDYYVTDVVTATDYAPFGAQLPGRTYRSNGKELRYGYNGKENDNEVKGEGNQQDYGMRISDPRLGRFLSVDPLTKEFPMLTPYQYAANKPINSIDLDGLEDVSVIDEGNRNASIAINLTIVIDANTPNDVTKARSSTIHSIFSRGDETIYLDQLPNSEGSNSVYSKEITQKEYESGIGYKVKVGYNVNSVVVKNKDLKNLLEKNKFDSKYSFLSNDVNTTSFSDDESELPVFNSSTFTPLVVRPNNKFFKESSLEKANPTIEELIAHETGYHNMMSSVHANDPNTKKAIYPNNQTPSLESKSKGMIYPVRANTLKIINSAVDKGGAHRNTIFTDLQKLQNEVRSAIKEDLKKIGTL